MGSRIRAPHGPSTDGGYFVPLLGRTAEHFQIREVSAGKACLGRKNFKAVERAGGTSYVPFKFPVARAPSADVPFISASRPQNT